MNRFKFMSRLATSLVNLTLKKFRLPPSLIVNNLCSELTTIPSSSIHPLFPQRRFRRERNGTTRAKQRKIENKQKQKTAARTETLMKEMQESKKRSGVPVTAGKHQKFSAVPDVRRVFELKMGDSL